MFRLGGNPLELVIRGTVIYLTLFLLFRVVECASPDRPLCEASAMITTSVTEALIVVATIFAWNWVIDQLNFHVPALRSILEPPPLALVEKGRVLHRNLRHEHMTLGDEFGARATNRMTTR